MQILFFAHITYKEWVNYNSSGLSWIFALISTCLAILELNLKAYWLSVLFCFILKGRSEKMNKVQTHWGQLLRYSQCDILSRLISQSMSNVREFQLNGWRKYTVPTERHDKEKEETKNCERVIQTAVFFLPSWFCLPIFVPSNYSPGKGRLYKY